MREHEGMHTYVGARVAAQGYAFLVRRYIRIDSIGAFADVVVSTRPYTHRSPKVLTIVRGIGNELCVISGHNLELGLFEVILMTRYWSWHSN